MKRGKILGVSLFLVLLLLIPVVSVWSAPEEEAPTTTAARTGKYGEAPMLAERVAAGELPPVDDRLPSEPMVVKPFETIGTYGGRLQVLAVNNNPD